MYKKVWKVFIRSYLMITSIADNVDFISW